MRICWLHRIRVYEMETFANTTIHQSSATTDSSSFTLLCFLSPQCSLLSLHVFHNVHRELNWAWFRCLNAKLWFRFPKIPLCYVHQDLHPLKVQSCCASGVIILCSDPDPVRSGQSQLAAWLTAIQREQSGRRAQQGKEENFKLHEISPSFSTTVGGRWCLRRTVKVLPNFCRSS